MTVAVTELPTRRSGTRGLAVLALLGFGAWALLTVVLGVSSVVDGIREVGYVTSPHPVQDPEPILFPDPWLTLSSYVFVLWLLSFNVAALAAVLGIVHVALESGSWLRCVAFGVVALGAPAASMVILLTDDPYFGETSYPNAVGPGLAMTGVALVGMLAAWRLLRPPRPTASSR